MTLKVITDIRARQVLDSRGHPAIEISVCLDNSFWGRNISVSGASVGQHEAKNMLDGGEVLFGLGVNKALSSINNFLIPQFLHLEFSHPHEVDQKLRKIMKKENVFIGSNVTTPFSIATTVAYAKSQNTELFCLYGILDTIHLPALLSNVVNGGKHAGNKTSIQEVMIIPSLESISQNVWFLSEINHSLYLLLRHKNEFAGIGDEGGWIVNNNLNFILDLIIEAADRINYTCGTHFKFALDVAANNLYHNNQYWLDNKKYSSSEIIDHYESLVQKYPIVYLEDGISEHDILGWQLLTERLGKLIKIVGDDIFVTNVKHFNHSISCNIANGVIVKPNQVGTLWEAQEFVRCAHSHSYISVMSHRSGDNENDVLADLAVAFGCHGIKCGGVMRSERTIKYNRLLLIEKLLKDVGVRCLMNHL